MRSAKDLKGMVNEARGRSGQRKISTTNVSSIKEESYPSRTGMYDSNIAGKTDGDSYNFVRNVA